ncbi:MAG: PLP-dependent aspartate aminotransferase family protein [Rhodospirillales bacterium]|nr:PLP-dependent aspartate aminotransferase family protein [Rhodospirillales bacterium]
MSGPDRKSFDTRVIHAGQAPDAGTGSVVTPIYATATFAQESPGKTKGYEYARSANPTRDAYEACIADLESGAHGFAFASGMAATTAVIDLLDAGDRVLALRDLYGGTTRLFEQVRKRTAGLVFDYADVGDAGALDGAIHPDTRLIWLETPSNPMLNLVDLAAVASVARSRGILTAVDNTFATPWAQRPLELGIDIVVHSATKYLNGHSDVIGGAVVVGDDDLAERLGFLQNATGGIAGPFDSFLVLRGLKTLSVRMERHCANALKIARWLEDRPEFSRVLYPGLSSHPGHEICRTQMNGRGGGMVTAVLDRDLAGTVRFLERCRVFTLAESLGGVESLIEHPAIMTHASVPKAVREEVGIADGLVRLSVGIEDAEDLIADLRTALD